MLPKPVVRSVITEESDNFKEIQESIEFLKKKGDKLYQEYEKMLKDIVKIIHKQPGIKELVQQSVKPGGKYIYFCPVTNEEGVNDIPTIQNKMMEYLQEKYPNQKIVFYSSTSKDGELGKKNRDSFYHDVDLQGNNCQDAIRIIFVINQYNEGVHAPNVDGVFLGRKTGSDIVAFEQIGRALSVRGDNYQELEKYRSLSLEELRNLATSRGLPIENNFTKEQIIDVLVSPLIIDLANNMEFIEELETNLGTRLKETYQEQNTGKKRIIKITDSSINTQIINHELLEILKNMRERLRTKTWDDWFELLKAFYEHHGHTNVHVRFKTTNGYEIDKNGKNLGTWVSRQRNSELTPVQHQKLSTLNFIYDPYEHEWNEMYDLLKKYHNHYGHANVPGKFKTTNGYNEDKNGKSLGEWVATQRKQRSKLSQERKRKLTEVNFIYDILENNWNEMYELLKKYYEHHGHTDVSSRFKTTNGYEEDENGKTLGLWVATQRKKSNKLSQERREKLATIEFTFEKVIENNWNEMYEL